MKDINDMTYREIGYEMIQHEDFHDRYQLLAKQFKHRQLALIALKNLLLDCPKLIEWYLDEKRCLELYGTKLYGQTK